MPCRDYSLEEIEERDRRIYLDKLTSMLCETIHAWEEGHLMEYYLGNNAPDIKAWWVKHKEDDRKRIAEERKKQDIENKRKKALGKLSKAERKLLGID